MSNPELENQKLAQLQAGQKGPDSEQNAKKYKDEQAAVQDAKNSILSQILDQPARARLNTLLLGKPEKGQMVENMLIRMAQTGQICTKIGERELIGLLENVSSQTKPKTSIKFDRRRAALDDDDNDY
ncbi:hypothetical protein NQ317_019857 [Molorchus minor]|uniref:Programmed cell death protein 5 n=1 Tax=Molorchus minor TaxID=1323400 RepID=A0ABQ9K1B6_9CUCU|nr:hypothetical protein NQ317_019857 [Molorchus minor]